ncbi:MAG TPA: GxxExxY protein [Gemmatimonadaceae bacterium]
MIPCPQVVGASWRMSLSYPESNELTGQIIAASIEVHRHLGAGLLESAYDDALYLELREELSVNPHRLQVASHQMRLPGGHDR